MVKPLSSFHAYSVGHQLFIPYSRHTPLKCDLLEWDTTGCFDTVNSCFVASCPMIVEFHANILWERPAQDSGLTLLIIKNILPPPDGSIGGEIAGDDSVAYQPSNQNVKYNQSNRITRKIKLDCGDRVWAVPCINGQAYITNSIASPNNYNTVNYFEGIVLELL